MHQILPLLLAFPLSALAHKHHAELTEDQTNAPVDAILWIHIFLQAIVWGMLFPVGMVLGITRSRWHVPLQVNSIVFLSFYHRLTTSLPERRLRTHYRWLLTGPRAQRTAVSRVCARFFCFRLVRPNHHSVGIGYLFETPHS
jgi:Domain of unknown function (DUF2427)